MMKKLISLLLALLLFAGICLAEPVYTEDDVLVDGDIAMTDDLYIEYGYDYLLRDEVALYLYAFGELPYNYLTKHEAEDLGWDSRRGNLWDCGDYLCIGGDTFRNREKQLPEKKGRKWYECDVNYDGGYRGSDRILFSTDGLIYFTEDHYETFTLLFDGWYDTDYRYE